MKRTKQRASVAYDVELIVPYDAVIESSVVLQEALTECETDLIWEAITQAELHKKRSGILHIYELTYGRGGYEIVHRDQAVSMDHDVLTGRAIHLIKIKYQCSNRKYEVVSLDPVVPEEEQEAQAG